MKELEPSQCQAILTKRQACVVRGGVRLTVPKVTKTRCTQVAGEHGLCFIHAKMQREGKPIERTED